LKKVSENKKKHKIVDKFMDNVPEELKDFFTEEVDLQDERPIGKRITRSQAKPKDFSLAELQAAEQSQRRFDQKKKKTKK
jgi:hypothetical protein